MSDNGSIKGDMSKAESKIKGAAAAASAAAEEFANDAGYSLKSAMARIEAALGEIYEALAVQGGRGVKVIERQVDERPLASLLAAFGVGLIVGLIAGRDR